MYHKSKLNSCACNIFPMQSDLRETSLTYWKFIFVTEAKITYNQTRG